MKNFGPSFRNLLGALMILPVSSAIVLTATQVSSAHAEQRGPVQRVVLGKVVDKADAALKGAIVYLKDTHSLSIKSSITDESGSYRFGQLAQNVDYEVWAESAGKKSPTKTVSSFDSKNEFNINLKIDTGK